MGKQLGFMGLAKFPAHRFRGVRTGSVTMTIQSQLTGENKKDKEKKNKKDKKENKPKVAPKKKVKKASPKKRSGEKATFAKRYRPTSNLNSQKLKQKEGSQHNAINFKPLNGRGMRKCTCGRQVSQPLKKTTFDFLAIEEHKEKERAE